MARPGPLLLAAGAALLLAGCAAMEPPQPPQPQFVEPFPQPPAQAAGRSGGGVYAPQTPWLLTSDSRAFRPGDVLTVVLQETTQASKRAGTQFGKESSLGISPTVIAGNSIKTDISAGASNTFNGSSSSTQQNTLQGAITVIVHRVLPNGLLLIQGEKSLYLNQGEELIRVTGYVRAGDIDTENRVSSQRIANANIVYSGRGTLADANSAGWLSRFFVSPWMPF
ncbi:flagellar basal body L-ring protein FlgH [Paracidovorax anthurii]|uniref:Flagellar L-ring protein n=1 Tax=Paracidovorax anthurii TaxID=78229 RepID=A0A328YSY9_9BURK|nr:flagellar basal body L-ring protein FlgH [Paracidovorax anthurii]RAR76830.1 flagellar L-ring protein precursor FlgH [Paracidovorax anthurii]